MDQDPEEAWRNAVRDAQATHEALSSDLARMDVALESLTSRVGMLIHSTVSPDSEWEQEVVRGDRLKTVTQSGVDNIRRAAIDVANAADDLRRALDFYHH